MIIKVGNEELREELVNGTKEFPRYTTQILNLANQNAQGTRPKVVGQLSELIKECPEKTYEGWRKWYLERHPEVIDNACEKISEMVKNLRSAIEKIDEDMIKDWVEDLVLEKTFIGLRFQEVILKKVAAEKGEDYRISTPEEEAKGVDGFIGEEAVSVKPSTYKAEQALSEQIDAKIIYYKKTKSGLEIDASKVLNS